LKMSSETVKPITDVVTNEIGPSLLMNFLSWGTSMVITIVKIITMFTTCSVGMVYFK